MSIRFTNVDLHCHTTASDGKLHPQQLLELAVEREVTLLAITDHDNTLGYRQALIAQALQPELNQVELISGIEFSTQWRGVNVHVVGLGMDINSAQFVAAEQHQAAARRERAEKIAQRLEKKGMPDIYELALSHAASADAIGRPHFAMALIEKGYVSNFDMAFNKWLGAGKIGDVKVMWPTIEMAVQWIVASGGVAVLAHPLKYKMTRTKLTELINEFSHVGGAAMEVASCQQTSDEQRYLLKLAKQFGLLASRGSDYHGDHMPWNSLGRANPLHAGVEPVWTLFN